MRRASWRFACVAAAMAIAVVAPASAGDAPQAKAEKPQPPPAEQNPNYYAELANVNMRYNEYEKAAELFTKAMELSGEKPDPAIAFSLAKAYMALGQTDKADAAFMLPLDTMNENRKVAYLINVSQVYKGQERYRKAEEMLLLAKKTAEANGTSTRRVTNELLDLYRGTPLGMEARAAYEKRLRDDPNDTEAMRALMDLYLYDSKLEEAAKMAERYSKARPDDVAALRDLGFFYVATGDMPKAVAVTEKLIEKDPANKAAHYTQVINLYNELGDLDMVEKWADKAARDGVRSAGTYVALADSYLRAKKKDRAIECYKKAIELNPQNNRYRYQYARLLDQTGKTDEAKAIFEELSQVKGANIRQLAQAALIEILKREAGEKPADD